MSRTNIDFRFTSRGWITLVGVFAILFSGLGGYIAYCQLLDSKGIEIEVMKADPERAIDLIRHPEIITPCIDSLDDTCTEQYGYCTFMVTVSVILFCMGCTRIHANSGLFKSKARSNFRLSMRRKSNVSQKFQVHPENTNEAIADPGAPTTRDRLSSAWEWMTESWIYEQMEKLKPGEDLFWLRCHSTLVVDVVMQLLRCFVVEGSYSKTAAPQFIAQIILIGLNVDFCMLMFYLDSEVFFAATSWAFEIMYLMVRLSLHGSLSMRASSLLDFITIAIPFFSCTREIQNITHFIRAARRSTAMNKKQKTRRGLIALIVALIASITTLVISHVGVAKWYEECPSVHYLPYEPRPEDSLQPLSTACRMWQFNFMLSPGCSCAYVEIIAHDLYDQCGVFNEDPEHTKFQSVFPHFEDVRFLQFQLGPSCPLIAEDFELIMSWTQLNMVVFDGLDIPEIDSEFAQLENLISFHIGHSSLTRIDVNVLKAWRRLEHFSCRPCPYFESQDVFTTVELPRLKRLELYGSSSCPSRDSMSHIENYECVSQNQTEQCEAIPEWFLEHYVDIARSATRTECYNPICNNVLTGFVDNDGDQDGLANVLDFRERIVFESGVLGIQYQDFSDSAYYCMFTKIREAMPFEQNFYDGLQIQDGLTVLEWAALETAYGNCGDCERTAQIQKTGAERYVPFDPFLADNLPQECKAIWSDTPPADLSTFQVRQNKKIIV